MRKITGMILLVTKLGATLDFKSALAPYLIERAKQVKYDTML
jgi:hypothetical protein